MKALLKPVALTALLLTGGAGASDHADPVRLENLEAGITDLFAFPQGDNLVLILGVRRALGDPAELPGIEDFEYRILLDWDTPVTFSDPGQLARFGGSIMGSAPIEEDAVITLRLNADLSLDTLDYDGLLSTAGIRSYTGVRDDPFIFPRFFGTNVVAMVLEIPISAFPAEAETFLLWGTSSKDGKQVDHVGRSNRTMQPRLDLLNTLHPREHLTAIQQAHDRPDLMRDVLRNLIQPVFAFRAYDFAPDVMIYSRRFPAGYPNGRLLTDDVAARSCDYGDCLLWELSWGAGKEASRATRNDLPFLDTFPYLAEPHPNPPTPPAPALTLASKGKLGGIAALALAFILLPWALLLRTRLQLRDVRAALARNSRPPVAQRQRTAEPA